MNRWIILAIIIFIGGSSWIWISRLPNASEANASMPNTAALGASEDGREASAVIGHPAPNFTLTTLDGQPFELATLQGQPVVLNFWATWCGPCRRELPALQSSAERYAGQVTIVGVDQAEPPETVQAYVDELGLTFTIPMDTDTAVGSTYGVRGMPTTFFIDSQGVIQKIWSGEMNSITLAESILELLE